MSDKGTPHVMDRLLAAVQSNDLEEIRDCFTPDGAVWHGYDCILSDVDSFIQSVCAIAQKGIELRYYDIERHPTPTGFVQQHLLVMPDGEGGYHGKPCCMVVHLKDGRIFRAFEYLDRTGVLSSTSLPMRTPGL